MGQDTSDLVVAGCRGLEGAGPTHGEGAVIDRAGNRRRSVPVEVDLLVGASYCGCSSEVVVVEVFGLKTLCRRVRSCAQLGTRDNDCSTFGVGRTLSVEDLC